MARSTAVATGDRRKKRSPVDRAMPDGTIYAMPEEWRDALAKIEQRYESPSSVSSFLSCPLRWYLERYSDLPDNEEPVFPTIVGSFVHRVLEVFYTEPSQFRTEELLMRVFRTAWDAIKQGVSTGIVPPDLQREFDLLSEYSNNIDSMRGAFFTRARKAVEGVLVFDPDPMAVEIVSTEMWVRMKSNGVIIRGKIDRVDRDPFGGERIEDYKGLALDTPIPTPSGWTTMGDLKVGDQVLGKNGCPTNVVVKSQVHNRPCYRITFMDGSSIVCDNVHLWQVSLRRDDAGHWDRDVVLNADVLYERFQQNREWGFTRSVVIDNPAPLDLPERQYPIDPWLLGAWLGDGNSKDGHITVGKQDTAEMAVLLKEAWPGNVEWWEYEDTASYFTLGRADSTKCLYGHETRTNQYGYSGVVLCSECVEAGITTNDEPTNPGLRTLLNRLGLIHNKQVPVEYLRGSYNQRLALLQGLMDTDGSWNDAHDRAIFSNTNKALSDAVAELVASLGVTPCRADVSYANEVREPATDYRVLFQPNGFNPFRLARKAARANDSMEKRRSLVRSSRRTIRSMERVDSVPTQCIKVDAEDSLYLAGPLLTPTHNTGRLPDDDEEISFLSVPFVPIGMYALMRTLGTTRDGIEGVLVSKAQLLYLMHGVKYNLKVKEGDLDDIQELVDRVTDSMNTIAATGDIMATPGETPDDGPCTWCPAKGLCPAWTDGTFKTLRKELEI